MLIADPRVERAFVTHLWAEFAAGRSIRCLREEDGAVALSVTQTVPQAYQLRCTSCSWHSDWFLVEGDRLRSVHAAETRPELDPRNLRPSQF
jgi:hypothetical protein